MLGKKRHRAAVAGGQRRVLALPATIPDRPHRMNDVAGRQPITFGDLGVARGAAAQRTAFHQQVRASSAMDRAVDAPAAQQRIVRRVDDRIDIESCNVGDDDVITRRADPS